MPQDCAVAYRVTDCPYIFDTAYRADTFAGAQVFEHHRQTFTVELGFEFAIEIGGEVGNTARELSSVVEIDAEARRSSDFCHLDSVLSQLKEEMDTGAERIKGKPVPPVVIDRVSHALVSGEEDGADSGIDTSSFHRLGSFGRGEVVERSSGPDVEDGATVVVCGRCEAGQQILLACIEDAGACQLMDAERTDIFTHGFSFCGLFLM